MFYEVFDSLFDEIYFIIYLERLWVFDRGSLVWMVFVVLGLMIISY